jgi:hypothetical protein
MLAKCDEIGYIKKFFCEMLEKNVVYWNENIYGMLSWVTMRRL